MTSETSDQRITATPEARQVITYARSSAATTTLVEDVMTWGPNTVRPDQLASEALEILNSLKRTVLLVVDGEHAVGLVHMHDLLRAGVA